MLCIAVLTTISVVEHDNSIDALLVSATYIKGWLVGVVKKELPRTKESKGLDKKELDGQGLCSVTVDQNKSLIITIQASCKT